MIRSLCNRLPVTFMSILLIFILIVTPAIAGEPGSLPAEGQWWKGVIEVPGQPLDFSIVFRLGPDGKTVLATLDIPIQQARDLPMVDVAYSDTELSFAIPAPANAVFKITRDGAGKATGTMVQHGMTFPVSMELTTKEGAADAGPPRPQTPKPPFPYKAIEVTYKNAVDGTKLAGTLTIPDTPGRHPAVLLITGSGSQDRDETIFGHKLFLVLADHFTRKGIAVLRVDDRGVGGSGGKTMSSTSEDFAGDVCAGVEFLKSRPEIDPERIGLLGHSEGGIIAPMVAARRSDVACLVSLAGSALPGSRILNLQLEASLRGRGLSEDWIKKHSKIHRRLLRTVMSGGTDEEILRDLRELIENELAGGGTTASEEDIQAMMKPQFAFVASPWMRWFLEYDPRDALARFKCPVLALIGSLDFQVPAEQNIPAYEAAFAKAGNKDATVRVLDGLNHLFQPAKTGMLDEYQTIETTIDPAALNMIRDWLCDKLEVGKKAG